MHPSHNNTTHTAIGGTVVFSTLRFAPTDANPDAECRVVVWIRQPGRSGLMVACSVPTGFGTKGFEAGQAMRRRLAAGTPCAAYGASLAKPKPRDEHGSADKIDLILRGCSYIRSTATVRAPLQDTTPRVYGSARSTPAGSLFDDSRPLPRLDSEFLPTIPYTPERHRAAA